MLKSHAVCRDQKKRNHPHKNDCRAGRKNQPILWSGRDLLLNRMSTLRFALLQLPLFWVHFDKTFPQFTRARLG